MLKNGSAPTTNGTKRYRLDKQIRRDFFPAFSADTPNEEREKLHAELIGVAMDEFKATPGIANYAGLDDLVESLKTSFEILLTPMDDEQEETSDLQEEMEQAAGDSTQFESRVGELNISTEDIDEESGDTVVVPMGQIAADTIQTLSAACVGLDAMYARLEEVDFDADPTLESAIKIAISKLGVIYGKTISAEAIHGVFTDVLDVVKSD